MKHYKQGQQLKCRVLSVDKDGCEVTIIQDNLPASLKTASKLKPGDEVIGVFVCVYKGRILLSQLFAAPRTVNDVLGLTIIKADKLLQKNDLLDLPSEPDPNVLQIKSKQSGATKKAGSTGSSESTKKAGSGKEVGSSNRTGSRNNNARTQKSETAYKNEAARKPEIVHTAETVKKPEISYRAESASTAESATEPDITYTANSAKNAWSAKKARSSKKTESAKKAGLGNKTVITEKTAGLKKNTLKKMAESRQPSKEGLPEPSPKKKFVPKRAEDLIPPPITLKDKRALKTLKMSEYSIEKLIEDLERAEHTGCLKVSCNAIRTRSAALLYKGRVVGAFHSSSKKPQTKTSEEALPAMLSDLARGDGEVTLYHLPETVILSMSALFLGYPVASNPGRSASENIHYIMEWFADHDSTVCVAIVAPEAASTYLAFMFKGKFIGMFNVETQEFKFVDELDSAILEKYPRATAEASLHAPDWLDGDKPVGFSLTETNRKRLDS